MQRGNATKTVNLKTQQPVKVLVEKWRQKQIEMKGARLIRNLIQAKTKKRKDNG